MTSHNFIVLFLFLFIMFLFYVVAGDFFRYMISMVKLSFVNLISIFKSSNKTVETAGVFHSSSSSTHSATKTVSSASQLPSLNPFATSNSRNVVKYKVGASSDGEIILSNKRLVEKDFGSSYIHKSNSEDETLTGYWLIGSEYDAIETIKMWKRYDPNVEDDVNVELWYDNLIDYIECYIEATGKDYIPVTVVNIVDADEETFIMTGSNDVKTIFVDGEFSEEIESEGATYNYDVLLPGFDSKETFRLEHNNLTLECPEYEL